MNDFLNNYLFQARPLQLQKQLSQYSSKSLKDKNLIDIYKTYITKSKKQNDSQS